MLQIVKIPYQELEKYITIAFQDDDLLVRKIHISPGTLQHCVNETYTSVADVAGYGGCYHKLVYEEVEIGFLVTLNDPRLVVSFGINIQSRKRAILESFLVALREFFDNNMYMVGVHGKNKRAVNFFVKNNFDFFSGKDKTVYLVCPSSHLH